MSETSLGGALKPVGEKLAMGLAVLTLDAGECFIIDFTGELDRGGGLCIVPPVTGVAEKWADRLGLIDPLRPRPAPVPPCRGTSRLDAR